jgi:alkyl sulfatase BDS1-like metallo-beta-lactamase superfamily hydrolase
VAFDGLRALSVNCTLKRSPDLNHTEGLVDKCRAVMQARGVDTEHGWVSDEWPAV